MSRRGSPPRAPDGWPPGEPSSPARRSRTPPRSPRAIRWVPVRQFTVGRSRAVVEHVEVLAGPVAMVRRLRWRTGEPVTVQVLRPPPSLLIVPVEWQLRGDETPAPFALSGPDGRPLEEAWREEPDRPYLARERPAEWTRIVREVRRAVRDFVEHGTTGIVLDGQVRVTAER